MRIIHIVIFALAMVGLSGCIEEGGVDPDSEPGSETPDGDAQGEHPAGHLGAGNASASGLPEPIQEEGEMTASADPLNMAGQGICGETASCSTYPFTLNRNAHISAKLTWGLPVHDLDLYLLQGGQQVVNAATAPSTEESFATEITRGQYEVVVVGWLVTTETFKLDVQFS